MQFLAFLMYLPLQILWFPLTLIGVAIVAYRQLIISKRMGVSHTAVEIINGRWAMDVFGLRSDDAARELAGVIANNSVFGLWLTLFPIWAVSRLLGKPFLYPTLPAPKDAKLANLVPSRTAEFDALIKAKAPSCAQLVILGAGLDTRAYGELKASGLAIYELDERANQAHKIASLSDAGIDNAHVRFVPVDFGNANWTEGLLASDYDPAKTTIFLWEGVTLYLPAKAVGDTLDALKTIAPAGSAVLADIYSQRFVNMAKGAAVGWSLEMTGEAIKFGLDFSADAGSTLKRFAADSGVHLGHHQFLGSSNKHGPFVVIAELIL